MMQRIRRITVNGAAPEQLSLEGTLHLVWQWMKYSGIHPNLLLISVEEDSTSNILRGLFTLIILMFSLVLGIFEAIQLIIQSWSVQNMVDVVPNVIITLPFLYEFLFQYHFWSNRHQMKQFFENWKLIEEQMNCFESSKLKRNINRISIMIYSNYFVLTILLAFWNWMDPERSLFLTHCFVIRDIFGILPTSIASSVVSGYSFHLSFINLAIPMICFYVIARYVESLEEEWELSSKNERFLRVIWQRYENILHLVNRANESFGAIINELIFILIVQGFSLLFYCLKEFQRSLTVFLVVLIFFITGSLSIVIFNGFMSRLYFSKDKLQKSIADHLSLKWYEVDENDRQLLVTFLARLEKDEMCVCPMKLYSINPSNLLGISATIINYFIVLAQANK